MSLLEAPRVAALCREGIPAGSVLDVGTGTGVFAEVFVSDHVRVVGLDPDAVLLAIARTLVPGAEFREGVAESLPFIDSSFDLVFLGHVLHETDDPLSALQEARRVSRGRVAVLEWPWLREEQGPPLEHRMKPERIEALAREAGFLSVERISLSRMELFRLSSAPAGVNP